MKGPPIRRAFRVLCCLAPVTQGHAGCWRRRLGYCLILGIWFLDSGYLLWQRFQVATLLKVYHRCRKRKRAGYFLLTAGNWRFAP